MASGPTRQQPPTSTAPASSQPSTAPGSKLRGPDQQRLAASQVSPLLGYTPPGLPDIAPACVSAAEASWAEQQFTPTATTSSTSPAIAKTSPSGSPALVRSPETATESHAGTPAPASSSSRARTSTAPRAASTASTSSPAPARTATPGRPPAR